MTSYQDKAGMLLLKSKLSGFQMVLEQCDSEAHDAELIVQKIIKNYFLRRPAINVLWQGHEVDIDKLRKEAVAGETHLDYLKLINALEAELAEENKLYDISTHPAFIIGMDVLFITKTVIDLYERIHDINKKYIWDGIYKKIKNDQEAIEEEKEALEELPLTETEWREVFSVIDELIIKYGADKITAFNFNNLFRFKVKTDQDKKTAAEYITSKTGREIYTRLIGKLGPGK